jgi:signal transduction histidine kinase
MEEIGLANAIRELAAHAGRPVEVAFDPRLAAPSLLPIEHELQAYRIVQEAVANAVRHASAATIVIGLRSVRGSRLQIEVVDDGTGFDPRKSDGDGLGLQGMRERAAAIGGTLSLDSRPGLGTRMRLLLPLLPQHGGAEASGPA